MSESNKPTHFTNISHQLNTWLLSKWNTLWKFANLMFSPSSFSLSFKKGTMRVHTWSPLLVVEYVATTQIVLLSQLIGHVSPFFWAALHRVVSTVALNNIYGTAAVKLLIYSYFPYYYSFVRTNNKLFIITWFVFVLVLVSTT